jgi:hypothetical protein
VNSITSIYPYKCGGLWVFDDEAAGLRQEPFIAGGDRQMFRRMVAEALERRGMPVYTSEKERSKHLPWV